MRRILSALVLMPLVGAAVWFLAPLQLLLVVLVVLLLAFVEYARLVERLGVRLSRPVAGTAVAAVSVAAAWPGAPLQAPLLAVVVVLAALAIGEGSTEPVVLHRVGAVLLAAAWLGLPLGTLVALHAGAGRGAVLLLIAVVIISDTAQLYLGMLFGRHRLAPVVSPKKTVEGAVAGYLAGMLAMVVGGRWTLPGVGPAWLVGLGALVVTAGILGDLFESLLKRCAGVKDSSGIIPGHGGVLDRIDAVLFAAPAFWVAVAYLV